jgi:hypothetical protein
MKASRLGSTVTQDLLKNRGSWEFVERGWWKIKEGLKSMAASDVYRPLSMKGEFLDITDSPVLEHGKSTELHIQILQALKGVKERLESLDLKLHLPMDWGVRSGGMLFDGN